MSAAGRPKAVRHYPLSVEYCRWCEQPLLLTEPVRDVGQAFQPTPVLCALARRTNLPAALVFYRVDSSGEDISSFRVREVHPTSGAEVTMTPRQYAEWLWSFREAHRCEAQRAAQQEKAP